jgi:para-nitrobenzyl esterase
MTTRRLFAATATLALGLFCSSGPSWSQDAAPTVKIHQGAVSGVAGDGTVVYRGIPFAAPPVGPLRWRAPQPAANWTGVRDGSKAGNTCAQAMDCLYLNVHVPAGTKPGAKLPVMFWIHGGSFTGGSGSQFDGSSFARKGVVVVTINYRLGREGFFAHPAISKENKEDKGNYGIMDQIAALKWVQANVAAFGGDASKVTVFGESAGAISIYDLMISPEAKGLFTKAISESGFSRYDSETLTEAEASGKALAEKVGVKGDGPDALKALRAVPFGGIPASSGLYDHGRPRPIVDGKTIPWSIPDAFAQGKEAKIPFLVGGNSNEASLLPTKDGTARIKAAVNSPVPYSGDPMKVANAMVTAEQILEPSRNAARLHTKNTGQPIYFYYFSYVTPMQRATSPGAAHGGELNYVFNSLRAGSPAEDQTIAQSMNAYWAAFAKYGNPGAAGGPAWPAWKPDTENYMEFSGSGPVVGQHLQAAGLDWAERELKGSQIALRGQYLDLKAPVRAGRGRGSRP